MKRREFNTLLLKFFVTLPFVNGFTNNAWAVDDDYINLARLIAKTYLRNNIRPSLDLFTKEYQKIDPIRLYSSLSSQIDDDFKVNKTVLVKGWEFSETEIQLCFYISKV